MSLADTPGTAYRPDIDGLRALAVLAVVFYHADIGLSGGYVGVDVFFVISGYLITSLILKDLAAGRFQLRAFWERRLRRIMPALVVMVFASVVACGFRFLPLDFKALGQSVVAQAALLANYYFYTVSGYFEQEATLKPLLHTWSLAVEEQFYLLFPGVLLLTRRCPARAVAGMIAVLGAASFSLSVWWSYRHAWAGFYFLPTRAWELLAGSLLATLPLAKGKAPWLREGASAAGLVMILAAMVLFDRQTQVPGLPALLPCGGALLIIAAGRVSSTLVGRCLSCRPLVGIGLISYSLYLWHWPVLVFSKYWALNPLSLSQRLGLVVISLGLAALSWRWVEQPVRLRRIWPARSQVFAAAGVASILLVILGGTISRLEGLPTRIPPAACQYASGASDLAFSKGVGLEDALAGRLIELGLGDPKQPVHVMVWGDSHALAVMPAVDSLCRNYGVRGVGAAYPATAPLVGYRNPSPDSLGADSVAYNDALARFAGQARVHHVLLVGNWNVYANGEHLDSLRQGLLATLQALQGSGARLWLLKSVPTYPWDVPKRLAAAVVHGEDPGQLGLSLLDYQQASRPQTQLFDELSARFPLTILDPLDRLAGADGQCRVEAEGWSLYRDHHHLSIHGALFLAPLFEPLFAEQAKASRPVAEPGAGPQH